MKRVTLLRRALPAVAAAVLVAGCSSPDAPATSAPASSPASPDALSAPAPSTPAPTPGASASPAPVGLEAASADEILAASRDALLRARSLRARGDVVSGGTTYRVDLRMVRGTGAAGTVAVDGKGLRLVRIGSTAYVRFDPAFLRAATNSEDSVRLLAGSYLKVTARTSTAFAPFAAFTDASQTFGPALAPAGTVTKGKVSTLRGRRVIDLLVDGGRGGHVFVALTGTPYPVRIVSGGKTPRRVDLDAFGAKVTLTPPPASKVRTVPGF